MSLPCGVSTLFTWFDHDNEKPKKNMYYGRDNTITVKCGDRVVKTYDSNTPEVRGLKEAILKGAGILPPFTAVVEPGTVKVDLFNEYDDRSFSSAQMNRVFDALCEAGDEDGRWFVRGIKYTGKSFEFTYEDM